MAGDFEHQEATYESCVPDFDIYDPDFDPDFNPQRATRENGPNILQVNEIQPGEGTFHFIFRIAVIFEEYPLIC